MELSGGDLLGPDVAFHAWGSLPNRRRPTQNCPAITPDLAVEVLSRGNTATEMRRKRAAYFGSGTTRVWELDPELRVLHAYENIDSLVAYTRTDTVPGEPVLPGFTLSLPDLFAEFDAHT